MVGSDRGRHESRGASQGADTPLTKNQKSAHSSADPKPRRFTVNSMRCAIATLLDQEHLFGGLRCVRPDLGVEGSLDSGVFLANRKKESRRADSNPWPTLITSYNQGVAGVCTTLQIPYI